MNIDEYQGERGYVIVVYSGPVPWVKTSRDGTPFGLKYATRRLQQYLDSGIHAELKKHKITLLDM